MKHQRHNFLKQLLLCALLAACTAVNGQSLTANLLYYLPINGNADDATGHGHNGTSTGTLVANRFGVPNSAYEFTGGQSITIPYNPDLQPQLPISVSFYAWFDANAVTAWANNTTAFNYTGYWMGLGGDGKINLNYGDGGLVNPVHRRSKNSNTLPSTGAWHHYVGVIRDWDDMDIYIDCVDAGGVYSGNGAGLFHNNQPGQLGIGAVITGTGLVGMSGKLDEIAFWNRALTPSDVEKICQGALNEGGVAVDSRLEDATIRIWPNPASGDVAKVAFEIPAQLSGIHTLELLSLEGKVLRQEAVAGIGKFEISVAGLAAGMYCLRFSGESGAVHCARIVVE